MTAVMNNNVIKISTNSACNINLMKNPDKLYPRTCDFCRDTYNSELTYQRHKETGKCFRFCRLREEGSLKQEKVPKRSIYPRTCYGCFKVYKNKHSYYKHKKRCVAKELIRKTNNNCDNQNNNAHDVDTASPTSCTDVDVIELAKDDIENIPITDNKENIDDISSKFILTIDVDKNCINYVGLYPRICETCHKVFKTQELFELHETNTKCSKLGKKSTAKKVFPTSLQRRRCEKCMKVVHKQLYNSHIKKCGKAVIPTVSVLKKATDFIPISQPVLNSSALEDSAQDEPPVSEYCSRCEKFFPSKNSYYTHVCTKKTALGSDRRSIYPRTCQYCEYVCRTKFQFHRHKKKCYGYQIDISDEDDDSYVSCDYCPRIFDTYSLYGQHMKNDHPGVSIQVPVRRRYMYPRKCSKCFNVYMSRQTFCNHKKRCTGSSDSDIEIIDESCSDENAEKVTYPRICSVCNRTYKNRQSFCNHRKLCPDFVFSIKEHLMYPRRCEHCLKIYSSKQTYHHHKVRCSGFDKFDSDEVQYPRTCEVCSLTFTYKQSYHNHLMTCLEKDKLPLREENDDGDENYDQSDFDCEPLANQKSSKRDKTYPRMCELCRKIYANRHTFCKHKSRCVPVTPSDSIAQGSTVSIQSTSPITYPRECENCFGTFKCEATFNAHKIRCDFFESKVDESEFKTYMKSNCEHCRNIVNQYRRIFHQHLEQCTDPIIVTPYPLEIQHPCTMSEPSVPNSSEDAKFCECCGVFFESRAEIELHKKSLQLSEECSANECDICMETFDIEEELTDHKTKCILNSSNKTYPRFCECCKKVYKTKQTFYNHKKNCHVHCLKYFVLKDCDNCKLPFKCEKMYFEHIRTCVGYDDGAIAAECEVSAKPVNEQDMCIV